MKNKAVIGIITILTLLSIAGSTAVPGGFTPTGGISSASAAVNVVDVTAGHLVFDAPNEIPSGWTTFRLHNESDMTHFAILERMPEGKGVADHQAEVAPVFQEAMDLINEGKVEEAFAKFGELPAWFFEVVIMGGPGLTSPGRTSEMTVYLEPGTYMLECYVKTDGIFHSYNPDPDEFGMVHEITVMEKTTIASAPNATLELTLSSENGIEISGLMRPGKQTIAVHFENQTVHENLLGHDVHLVRLEEDTDISELVTWMNWLDPAGLETPAPAEFLGGTHEMPAGETVYLNVLLKPGNYAWISEVPNSQEKGFLQTFTIPPMSVPGN